MATDSEGDSDGDSAQHTSSSDSDGDSDGDSAQHTSSSDSDGDSDGDSAQHTSSSDSDGDSDGDSAQHTSSSDSDGDSDGDSAQRATSRSSLPVLMRNSLNSNDDMHGRVPVAAVSVISAQCSMTMAKVCQIEHGIFLLCTEKHPARGVGQIAPERESRESCMESAAGCRARFPA
jgi:hypothetical protein